MKKSSKKSDKLTKLYQLKAEIEANRLQSFLAVAELDGSILRSLTEDLWAYRNYQDDATFRDDGMTDSSWWQNIRRQFDVPADLDRKIQDSFQMEEKVKAAIYRLTG